MENRRKEIILLIGIPGSGKTTYCLEHESDSSYISSDSIRRFIYGNESIQGDPSVVFSKLHKTLETYCMTGRERIVIDATNISRKDRTPYFQYRKYGYRYIAKVFNLPESICVLRDSSRDRKVGNRVISKMLKRFEMPCFWEGFDEIDLMYSPVIPFQNVINSMIDFDQMNPHHSLTLFNHCMKTAELIPSQANNYKELVLSAKIHDVGKLYTMSLESMPNESVKAHYYSHQNVGAYVSLCLDDDIDESLRIKRAQYIQWHMLPYFLITEKSKNKYKNMMGSFYDDLMILHEADEKAH